jgi:hypothetical protein
MAAEHPSGGDYEEDGTLKTPLVRNNLTQAWLSPVHISAAVAIPEQSAATLALAGLVGPHLRRETHR